MESVLYMDLITAGKRADNQRERVRMKIKVNPDRDIAEAVQEGLKRNNGYCPCVLEKTPDTKCMCKDFRDKVLDREFEGYCHCMLFYKEK